MSVLMNLPIESTGITTNEIPNHISFYIEFGNCCKHCEGCHSPHLWDTSSHKRMVTLAHLILKAKKAKKQGATAIVLMGGTTNGIAIEDFLEVINKLAKILPVGVYSGSDDFLQNFLISHCSNVTWYKTGSYVKDLGGLESPMTNQRFYEKREGTFIDCTERFRKNAT